MARANTTRRQNIEALAPELLICPGGEPGAARTRRHIDVQQVSMEGNERQGRVPLAGRYVQAKGRLVLLWARMYCSSLRRRSAVEVRMPRAMQWRSILANQSSTWLSHELQVGVKCMVTRGWAASQSRTR